MQSTLENAAKALRTMRRLLKDFPASPNPSEVHALRTQARRVEAILDAIAAGSGKEAKRILKAMRPVRKAAGGVRDMDVLIGNVFTLSKHDRSGAGVRLVEHLSQLRESHASRLHHVVAKKQSQKARKLLKRIASRIEEESDRRGKTKTEPLAALQTAAAELESWPNLDAENLHAFRLCVKKLRYMLQLSQSAGKRQMDALNDVKDAIGDWHDWTELLKIAQEVLDAKNDRDLVKQIARRGNSRYRLALQSSNLLRKLDLKVAVAGKLERSTPAKSRMQGGRRAHSS
jgi:CHAD domain-containing protein